MTNRHDRRRVTMSDVAKQAGVSPSTVSFVLNGVTSIAIPDATRERVQETAKKLGYRLNAAAKSLVTNQTHLIGFITDVIATTPFAGEIIRGAQETAWEHKKLLLVVNTNVEPDLAESAIELMLERKVEGIIYAAMAHHGVKPPDNIFDAPAVMLNCYHVDRTIPAVFPDELAGGRTATEVLLAKGHRRIGFLNLNKLESGQPGAIGRLEGYKQALAGYGIPFDEALVRYGNSMADLGYSQGKELLQLPDRPSAIFCTTDRIAMGLYDAARELGLRIPEDLAVMGFDNQEIIAAYLRPSLSTVALPFYEMGRWAVEYMINGAPFSAAPPVQHAIKCPLVLRESV